MNYTKEQKEVFGKNVWTRRQLLGMTTSDLAKAYGCTSNMVNVWERGASTPPKSRMKDLSKILKCSIHELYRPYQIPKLSFSNTSEVVKNIESEKISDAELIDAASKVFTNTQDNMAANVNTEENQIINHPVSNRLKKYLEDNNISQGKFSRIVGISPSTVCRVAQGVLPYNNPNYAKIENYLNNLENINTTTVSVIEPKQDVKLEPVKTELKEVSPRAKACISDRLNGIYDTLFNALAELDELKADISKIEKVTSMLKEIQGL